MKKHEFPNHICIRHDGDGALLIVGTPERVHLLDAFEGDAIATYTLNGSVKIFRQHPRLERV